MNNISFIIPAYNAEKTLTESVDSIFNDNFENGDEIIIIDDCSTDTTAKMADDLAKKYSNKITVLKNPQNKGCPASRNVGIKASKNDLIFNLDGDNVLPQRSISALKNALMNKNADVAAFQEYHYFKKNINEITHKWICQEGVFTLADLFSGTINPAPGGNFLYTKFIWEKVGGYWEYGKGLHEAWGYSFKLLINSARFIVVPNTFYYHRYSHESLFVRENKKNNESVRITNMFIENSLDIFSNGTIQKIKKNLDWFNDLEKKPLILKGQTLGKNGRIVFTSKLKQALCLIKKIVTK